MIIGNPSKLSVFSLNNRDFQVTRFKKSITLQPDSSYYSIETPCQLSEGCTISVNAYYHELINIKLIGWSKNCFDIQLDNFLTDMEKTINIDINICIVFSISKILKIGDVLTNNNFLNGY